MCLIKIHDRPKLTIFPKTVYKVLLLNHFKEYRTPYRNTPIKIGKTYTGHFRNTNTISDTVELECIEDGFIHSFISVEEAKEEKNGWDESAYIVKCKIPAFTHYYEGKYGEIASRRLKYIKIIE